MKESVNKTLIIITAVLAVMVIAAAGIFGGILISRKGGNSRNAEAEQEKTVLNQDSEGSDPEHNGSAGGDADENAEANAPADTESEGDVSGEELFTKYLEEELVPAYGVFRSPQEGVIRSNEMGERVDSEWLDPNGMFSASIYDFDKDGDEEMLIVVNREISKFAPPEDSDPTALSLVMYENENGEIHMSDAIVFGAGGEYDQEMYEDGDGEIHMSDATVFGTEGEYDQIIKKRSLSRDVWYGIRYAVSVTEIDGQVYLLCEDYTTALPLADGQDQNYWALTYHDKSLKYAWSFSQLGMASSGFEFGGYDYSDGECVRSEICFNEDEPEKADEEYRDMYLDEALTTFLGKHGISVGQELSLYATDGIAKSIYSDNPDVTRLFELKNECINADYEAGEYQYRITNLLYGILPAD
ncbi:MAG: hypothetical protein K6E34_10655 [Lachnospiraceae bacterium]|nr:hypothetical protein [Lachnospiraceae bacterium]